MEIRIGTLIDDYCGGVFGDSYGAKRVEGVGADWIVARELNNGQPVFAQGDDVLEKVARCGRERNPQ